MVGAPSSHTIHAVKEGMLGSMLSAIAYGIAATLYFTCLYLRVKTLRIGTPTFLRDLFLTLYTTVMFAGITVVIVSNIQSLVALFPDTWSPESSASPLAQFNDRDGIGYVGIVATFVTDWLAEALLIWRCYALLQGDDRRLRIGVGATLSLMLIALIVVSFIQIGDLYTGGFPVPTVVALFLSISINCLSTGIITVRLLLLRQRLIHVDKVHGTIYANIAGVLIESAALVVFFEIFMIVTFLRPIPALGNVAIEMFSHIQAIGSFLIVFRILQAQTSSTVLI